ncbi:hypothetical protein WJX77_010764 [Trebouxia sp. C0004]
MSKAQAKAAAVLAEVQDLPELVVFDLDYTLWPFWCEMYTTRDEPKLFPEARGVMEALKDSGVPMALASRTPTPEVARAFLQKLGLSKGMFVSQQLIPASSGFDHNSAQKDVRHFPAIQKETGISYNRMLFYDDEDRNIHRVSKLGVTSVLVSTSEGVSVKTLKQGLQAYSKLARSG